MNRASLLHWLERLETIHPREMDLGLERVAAVAQQLHLLPVSVPVISIAGTNGKGSTSAVLESLFGEIGRKVGVCSSPHFLRFNERIRVAGADVEDELIVEAFETIEKARGNITLTYFEFAALAALLIFRRLEVDVMVLEVGLGGRLDAINIVDATVAIITSIELDHQEWLGDTRELIAVEKAGILRSGRPAVVAEPEPPMSLRESVNEQGVKALFLGEDFQCHEAGGIWAAQLQTADGRMRQLPDRAIEALLPVNICAAAQALLLLGENFSDEQLDRALSDVRLTGRRESRRQGSRRYILDVAHNPAAVHKLLEYIDISPCNGRTIALFSVMSDKDAGSMVKACIGKVDAWFLADQPDNTRAMPAAALADLLRGEGQQMISTSKNLKQAFRRAQGLMSEGDQMLVFGSFFTVAGVLPSLEKDLRKEVQ